MKRTRKKQFRIPVTLALFCIAIIAVVLLFRTGNYPEAQPSIPLPVSGAQAEWNEMEKQSDTAWIDVPYLSQQNVLPTGCELVSAVMVLNYYGYKIDPITFAELVPQSPVPYDGGGYYIGSDPNEAFLGDPRTNHAYGCYAPVIVNAMNCIANENHIAQNTTEHFARCAGGTLPAKRRARSGVGDDQHG